MRIEFERTGGLMGVKISAFVDTVNLSDREAEEVVKLVSGANFFELPEKISKGEHLADSFHYRVSVMDNHKQHTLDVEEFAVPEPLHALIHKLVKIAMEGK